MLQDVWIQGMTMERTNWGSPKSKALSLATTFSIYWVFHGSVQALNSPNVIKRFWDPCLALFGVQLINQAAGKFIIREGFSQDILRGLPCITGLVQVGSHSLCFPQTLVSTQYLQLLLLTFDGEQHPHMKVGPCNKLQIQYNFVQKL